MEIACGIIKQIIRICWFAGALKLNDIKEYMKHKLYQHIQEDIKKEDILEYCKLYYARLIEVGGKSYLEATFPLREEQERILTSDKVKNWITADKLVFYPPRNNVKDTGKPHKKNIDTLQDLSIELQEPLTVANQTEQKAQN
ncbi:hypothetical protein RclHR1_06100002 [Rhizophagus clarus]|uniref:Uncharacterized protein n=1 Tax=Rhizophagus clarus TaxID=94130 RepID=A0A2Z6S8S4_9GLOM|nr:hypothetical protein RclHR1_06100002 [Rhizophagus clarus]